MTACRRRSAVGLVLAVRALIPQVLVLGVRPRAQNEEGRRNVAVCRYHPDRAGIGVCMRCRSVICAACCTRLEGVNHCHACLEKLSRRTERRPGQSGVAAAALGLLSVLCLFFFGVFWLLQGRLAP